MNYAIWLFGQAAREGHDYASTSKALVICETKILEFFRLESYDLKQNGRKEIQYVTNKAHGRKTERTFFLLILTAQPRGC